MRIGIDLDNTLLNYDSAFQAAAEHVGLELSKNVQTKNQIREFARSNAGGELLWQRLQGLVYGRYIEQHARLFPGVKRFLWRCRQRGNQVTIVSHKTEYGHFDSESISLREVALSCLALNDLLDPQSPLIHEVVFKSTREEKLRQINALGFDWFIDDLPEVINELGDVDHLNKILFSPETASSSKEYAFESKIKFAQDWQEIDYLINGPWVTSEIEKLVKLLNPVPIKALKNIKLGGNAGLYKVNFSDGKKIKLKIYPVDLRHDRIKSEFEGLTAIIARGIQNVPKPIAHDSNLGIGAYEWIEGNQLAKPNQNHVQACLDFLYNLHEVRDSSEFSSLPAASAACLSGVDIADQIRKRISQFDSPRERCTELDSYFSQDIIPFTEKLVSWTQKNWPKDIDFGTPLPANQRTLSPSDFGFHNAIERADGGLSFIDFEYFGWDDPVKLISDFSFHPGMNLSNEQKSYWITGALKIYGRHIVARLKAARPLFGLIWCLILLNDYRPEVWQRRLLANITKSATKEQILRRQMERSKILLAEIRSTYAHFSPEVLH